MGHFAQFPLFQVKLRLWLGYPLSRIQLSATFCHRKTTERSSPKCGQLAFNIIYTTLSSFLSPSPNLIWQRRIGHEFLARFNFRPSPRLWAAFEDMWNAGLESVPASAAKLMMMDGEGNVQTPFFWADWPSFYALDYFQIAQQPYQRTASEPSQLERSSIVGADLWISSLHRGLLVTEN